MNVFILNTGRCGSTTFIEACKHISNFSSAHESRIHELGDSRLAYPDNHIEADNRLAWFLGRLDQKYGENAFYVHLKRDTESTAESFLRRADMGIMKAYREGIMLLPETQPVILKQAIDYIETVNSNIESFLKDKPSKMVLQLETINDDFKRYWQAIGAEGDLQQALDCWQCRYNASP